ncbi:hypothetical protein [Mycobacteroides franklinii]|uniref:hypothetical protein n=1 Tax=Mycobacteroides franklinii TaxID=948102 RepID=UPI0013E8A678
MNQTRSLADLIELASKRNNGASGRRLAEIAASAGFDVSHSTLNRMRSATYNGVPNEGTIKAIAWLAGTSEEDAFAAAGQSSPRTPFASMLPPGVDNLGPSERRAVIEVLRAFTQHHQREWERTQREFKAFYGMAGKIATSLRASADLFEWMADRTAEEDSEEFNRMTANAAQPLIDTAHWFAEYSEVLKGDERASSLAHSEITEMFDAIEAIQNSRPPVAPLEVPAHPSALDRTAAQPDIAPENEQAPVPTGAADVVILRGRPIDVNVVFHEMRTNHNDLEVGAERIQSSYDHAGIKQGRAHIDRAYFDRDAKIQAIDELYNQINPEVFGRTTIRLTVDEWREWIDELRIAMARFDEANILIQEMIVEVIPQSQVDQLEGAIFYIERGIANDKIAADALEWMMKYWSEHEDSVQLIDVIKKADRLWESRPGMLARQQRNLEAVETALRDKRAALDLADSEGSETQLSRKHSSQQRELSDYGKAPTSMARKKPRRINTPDSRQSERDLAARRVEGFEKPK